MKVTFKQLETGLLNYMDREIIGQMDGLRKWGAMGAAAIFTAKGEALAAKLADSAIVQQLELVDGDGMIDLDTIKNALVQSAEKTGSVTQDIPIIGRVMFDRTDIEKAYQTIMEARG